MMIYGSSIKEWTTFYHCEEGACSLYKRNMAEDHPTSNKEGCECDREHMVGWRAAPRIAKSALPSTDRFRADESRHFVRSA